MTACEREDRSLAQLSSRISWLRLLFAILVLGGIFAFAVKGQAWGLVLAVAGIAAFIYFVKYHGRIHEKQKYNVARSRVAKWYRARFSDAWQSFGKEGVEFLKDEFPRGRDLDLFGRCSLFQFLCCANTSFGERNLAERLKNQDPKKDQIEKDQQAVKELSAKTGFCERIQCLTQFIPSKEEERVGVDAFIEAARKHQSAGYSVPRQIFLWGLPFVTILCLCFCVIGFYRAQCIVTLLVLMGLQLLITMLAYGKNGGILRPIFSLRKSGEAYGDIFEGIDKEPFQSGRLTEIQERLRQKGGAIKGLRTLSTIVSAVNVRYNGLAYLLCNGLFLWDFHCVDCFYKWRASYGKQLGEWLAAVGEIEALISLSVLLAVREDCEFPTICEGGSPELSFQQIKHPLMKGTQAVGNDFQTDARVCIITGSNMSGKTTFLRSIGLNGALAYAGAPVTARRFRISEMVLFTSMRVEDSVSDGISTFYAEILRIKSMVEAAEKGLPMLALIDEIFKGTNSRDRIIGAKGTLRKLTVPTCICLVTTHDFELCDLEREERVKAVNYHFSEQYIENEITFDYTLKTGRCETTNGRQLLRMAGIIVEEGEELS